MPDPTLPIPNLLTVGETLLRQFVRDRLFAQDHPQYRASMTEFNQYADGVWALYEQLIGTSIGANGYLPARELFAFARAVAELHWIAVEAAATTGGPAIRAAYETAKAAVPRLMLPEGEQTSDVALAAYMDALRPAHAEVKAAYEQMEQALLTQAQQIVLLVLGRVLDLYVQAPSPLAGAWLIGIVAYGERARVDWITDLAPAHFTGPQEIAGVEVAFTAVQPGGPRVAVLINEDSGATPPEVGALTAAGWSVLHYSPEAILTDLLDCAQVFGRRLHP